MLEKLFPFHFRTLQTKNIRNWGIGFENRSIHSQNYKRLYFIVNRLYALCHSNSKQNLYNIQRTQTSYDY